MDRVFSVDDIADQFWSPPPPLPLIRHADNDNESPSSTSSSSLKMMNRSSSEWAFQRFLQEASASNQPLAPGPRGEIAPPQNDVVEIKDDFSSSSISSNNNNNNNNKPPPDAPVDSEKLQAFLKSKLDLSCAAVALTRAKPKASGAVIPERGSLESDTAQPGSQVVSKGAGADPPLKGQDKELGGLVGIPSLPAMPKKSSIQVRSTTSGSSGEDSNEDEAEGETEATQNMDPADAKRTCISMHMYSKTLSPSQDGNSSQAQCFMSMLSNRESARRSRRRKQAHLTELETQASQMSVENSSLLKRLTDISQKYNEAAVDNRVLKADVETLRAKVKMAEETVKRVTGLSPLFQAMSEISSIGLPSFTGSPLDASAVAAVPVQDDPKHYYQSPPCVNHLPGHDPRIQNGMLEIPPVDNNVHNNPATAASAGNKMGRTSSMQRVASLEHLQKRIRGEVRSHGNQGNGGEQ